MLRHSRREGRYWCGKGCENKLLGSILKYASGKSLWVWNSTLLKHFGVWGRKEEKPVTWPGFILNFYSFQFLHSCLEILHWNVYLFFFETFILMTEFFDVWWNFVALLTLSQALLGCQVVVSWSAWLEYKEQETPYWMGKRVEVDGSWGRGIGCQSVEPEFIL